MEMLRQPGGRLKREARARWAIDDEHERSILFVYMRVSCDWDRADVKHIANWMHQTRLGKPTSWILQYFERQIAPWNIVILRARAHTHTHSHTMSIPRNTWRASKMPMFFALIAPVCICMTQLALVKRFWSGYLNCVHVVCLVSLVVPTDLHSIKHLYGVHHSFVRQTVGKYDCW